MKPSMKLIGVLILSAGVLTACSSNDEDKDGSSDGNSTDTETTNQDNGNNEQGSSGSSDDKADQTTANEDNNKNDEGSASSEEEKNQEDLKIGDTGTVKSNINKYEITLESVRNKKAQLMVRTH